MNNTFDKDAKKLTEDIDKKLREQKVIRGEEQTNLKKKREEIAAKEKELVELKNQAKDIETKIQQIDKHWNDLQRELAQTNQRLQQQINQNRPIKPLLS